MNTLSMTRVMVTLLSLGFFLFAQLCTFTYGCQSATQSLTSSAFELETEVHSQTDEVIFKFFAGKAGTPLSKLRDYQIQLSLQSPVPAGVEIGADFSDAWCAVDSSFSCQVELSRDRSQLIVSFKRDSCTGLTGFGKVGTLLLTRWNYSGSAQSLVTQTGGYVVVEAIDGKSNLSPQSLEKVLVYPNPFTDRLYLELPSNARYQIRIRDSMGRLVKEIRDTDDELHMIPMDQLDAGNYWIEIRNAVGEAVCRKRLILQR